MVWGTLHCLKETGLVQDKKRPGGPRRSPQSKTSTWSCSAYMIEENQVSSWQMKWEQFEHASTSNPALYAEGLNAIGLHSRVAGIKPVLQTQNIWWKDWNCKAPPNSDDGTMKLGTLVWWIEGWTFWIEEMSVHVRNNWRTLRHAVCSRLLNMGEAVWLSGVVSQLWALENLKSMGW